MTLGRSFVAAALLVCVVGLAACGESAEQKARAQVCDARADISTQIDKLSSLTISTSVITEAKDGVEAIAHDVTKIKNAQPDLNPKRKQEVEAATKRFGTHLAATVGGITSNLSLSNVEAQVKSALSQLADSYKQTLAPIDCS